MPDDISPACQLGHHTRYLAPYLSCSSTTCSCPCHVQAGERD